ncbi:SEM5B-like protein, partial [Mya arenaria]
MIGDKCDDSFWPLWSVWSSWGQCDVTCGNGTMSRVRTCGIPAPAHDGNNCVGDKDETVPCVLNPCPVGWTSWSGWTSCSVTCGTGLQKRSRSCQNPTASNINESCTGNALEFNTCTNTKCEYFADSVLIPVLKELHIPEQLYIHLPSENTHEYGYRCGLNCTFPNGVFIRIYSRDQRNCEDATTNCDLFDICQRDVEKAKELCRKYCNLCDVIDGAWAVWSSWGQCDVTCGSGTRSRVRPCDNPAPAHGGDVCQGEKEQTIACVVAPCTVGWTQWSEWSSCSVRCGTGLQKRSRSCQNPTASHINDSCTGDPLEFNTCTNKTCSSAFTATGYAPYGNDSIRFPYVILNDGNDYNSSTGVFTCRVPGLYLVTATLSKDLGTTVDWVACYIQQNGANKLYLYHDMRGDDVDGYATSTTGTFRLRVNDQIRI